MRPSWIGALLFFLASVSPAGEGAFLGVSTAPLDEETRAHFKVPTEVAEGVVLTEIHEGTAAETAGFKPGDVLVFFDGKPVNGVEELIARVTAHAPGDEVSYQLRRGSGTIEGTLKLGERPEAPPMELDARMERLQEEIDAVRRKALEKHARVVELQPGMRHPGLERWIAREEKGLVEARGKGDAEKVKFHEARLALLREMREAAPPELRLGLGLAAGGGTERSRALEERVARLEKKLDEVLERLNAPAAGR